ncbi:MAG: putative DNA binding domain-containing protein [Planctomycetaceae bacterium]
MDEISLRQEILKGEDSRRQFKREVTDASRLAAEVAAFLNTSGGQILVGVDDDGTILGLTPQQLGSLNQLVSNASTQHIQPSASILTENVSTTDGMVMVITVENGADKPYQTNDAFFWVKRGSDKRKVTSRSELQRMFQSGGAVYAEMQQASGATIETLDLDAYVRFFKEKYQEDAPEDQEGLERVLTASRLMKDGILTTAGCLLFGRNPEQLLPEFCVKAVWYKGTDRAGTEFYDSRRFSGTLRQQYEESMAFLRRWNSRIQSGSSFNRAQAEIPEVVFEELLTNALVHRDYFIHDSIKLLIFDDRIEIRSPGRLPNSLTVEAVRRGIRRERNPVLSSFAYDVMNYRGLGSGMLRVLAAIPNLELQNDVEAEEVTVIIPIAAGQVPALGSEA